MKSIKISYEQMLSEIEEEKRQEILQQLEVIQQNHAAKVIQNYWKNYEIEKKAKEEAKAKRKGIKGRPKKWDEN